MDLQLSRPTPDLVTLSLPLLKSRPWANFRLGPDSYVKKVEVSPTGADGRTEVRFHLTDKSIESFDYLTDSPSRLIVDFYRQVSVDSPPEVKETAKPAAPKTKKKAVASRPPINTKKRN